MVRMLTVWLPMCSTVVPMARGGGGDIPGNSLGQGFTSTSPFHYVQGASGAPIRVPSAAKNARIVVIVRAPSRERAIANAMKLNRGTSHIPLSAAI